MIDRRFWTWARWYMGHAEFKGHARDPRMRPPAPKVIPRQWWTELARRFIRTTPGPVIYPGPLPKPHAHPVFTERPLVWINNLDGFSLDYGLVERPVTFVVQILDGLDLVAVDKDRLHAYRTADHKILGWGWGKGDNPRGEAISAALKVADLNLDGYILNAEREYDGYQADGRWYASFWERSRHFTDAWDESIPLGVSTLPRSGMRHEAWQEVGACLLPQAYESENGATVAQTIEYARSVGWDARDVVPMFQAHAFNGATPDPHKACREAVEGGAGSICLYPADGALNNQAAWDALNEWRR